ncbi:transcription antitermination factor NusB [Aquifex sp.]
MKHRKKARELAFLTLYAWDLRGENPKEIYEEFVKERRISKEIVRIYSQRLLEAVQKNLPEIDATIEEFLKGWSFDRLGYVERNALRLGVAELLYLNPPDPGRVFIDILDIVKKYADEKSAKFVNGVLSAIYKSKSAPQKEKDEVKQEGK